MGKEIYNLLRHFLFHIKGKGEDAFSLLKATAYYIIPKS